MLPKSKDYLGELQVYSMVWKTKSKYFSNNDYWAHGMKLNLKIISLLK